MSLILMLVISTFFLELCIVELGDCATSDHCAWEFAARMGECQLPVFCNFCELLIFAILFVLDWNEIISIGTIDVKISLFFK